MKVFRGFKSNSPRLLKYFKLAKQEIASYSHLIPQTHNALVSVWLKTIDVFNGFCFPGGLLCFFYLSRVFLVYTGFCVCLAQLRNFGSGLTQRE
jgi:hypothetical protein